MLLQEGEEQVLLAQIDLVHLGELLGKGARSVPSPLIRQTTDSLLEQFEHLSGGEILVFEGVHRMAGGHLGAGLPAQRFLKNGYMHVAQRLDLLYRQPFVDKLLFHLGDLDGADVPDQLAKTRLDLLQVTIGVQVQDQFFERLLTFTAVVDILAHDIPPSCFCTHILAD